MKHISTLLSVTLFGVLLVVLFASGQPAAAQTATGTPTPQVTETASAPVCDPARSIQVSGTAVVNVTPDRALIQLGIQSNGTTVSKVEAANSQTIGRIVNAIKAQGVDVKDIATDWYIIQPIYEEYSSLKIKGYRINNTVAVTLRDISKVNRVLGAALDAGANQVINVEFYTSGLRKYRDQARELAMKASQEKAQAMTEAVGAETVCVLNISENTWSYYNGWWHGWYGGGGRSQDLWTQNTVQNADPAGGEQGGALTEAGPVSLGQISVKAEVGVTFGLK
jgi:hypothetical protein